MVITRIPRPQQKFFRTGGFAPEMWLVIEMLKKEFYAAFGDEFRYQFNFIFMETDKSKSMIMVKCVRI